MTLRSFTLALAFSALLLLPLFHVSASKSTPDLDLDEEDLSFLDDDAASSAPSSSRDLDHSFEDHSDDEYDPDLIGEGGFDEFDHGSYEPPAPIDDKDVVVLTDGNFSDFLESSRNVMVEFYAPWCGHCQALAPEYAAAATELKDSDVVLAKVDATEENDLAQKYEIQGFPTVLFFVDGVHRPYQGPRTKDAIVTWIKKKVGPAVYNITTTEEAEKILTSENKAVLGFLDSLVGPDSAVLATTSRLEDDVNFYQTVNPDVANLFHIDPEAKRPSLVMLKKEAEKLAYFDGQFTKSAILDFVFANKLPLVTTFTRETAPTIFDNPIKKQVFGALWRESVDVDAGILTWHLPRVQMRWTIGIYLLLFVTSNGSEKVLPTFEEVAKSFKGKLIFIYVEMDNEDVGKPVSDYFGVTGDGPKVLAYSGNEDAKKYILEDEVTLESVKSFAEGFVEDKLKPFYKSDPIPETNDGDVKIVVGNNFDDIVLDESKDVLLEIYAPWCGHCQALEPIYNKLAKHLRGINSIVIAKMDGTTNEHPRAKADGFPTLLFFPAGNKSFDPITVDTDRTVVAFYKFIKKHASIPFKLQKPVSITKSARPSAEADGASDSPSKVVKDEL